MLNLNCAICLKLITHSDEVYITLCGHMFHHNCLIQWLESSKTCPQCHNKCSTLNIKRVYFNLANLDASHIDVGSLQEQFEQQMKALKGTQVNCLKTIHDLKEKLDGKDFAIGSCVAHIQDDANVINDLRTQNNTLKQRIHTMKGSAAILTESPADADILLKQETNPDVLAEWASMLKLQVVNAHLALEVKEEEQNKAEQQIKNLKDMRGKCLKIIHSLKERLDGKDRVIGSYAAQVHEDANVINELRADNNTLKQQIDTMKGAAAILKESAADADLLLKHETNPDVLAEWASMLKLKLQQREIKNTELRKEENDLRKELWSLQDQLDNADTAIKMKEQEHIKFEQQINDLNDTLDVKNFTISSYESEIDFLKNYVQNNSLKQQMQTMEGVSAILSADAEDTDCLLKNEANPYVLANRVSMLKEKLRESEIKNTALRKMMKVMQHDSQKELDLKRKLEELLSHTESDPCQAQQTKTLQCQPIVLDQDIKSLGSNIKLVCSEAIRKTKSDLSEKYPIFKKPRLLVGASSLDVSPTMNPNFVDKDMGGSDKIDPFAQRYDENATETANHLNLAECANMCIKPLTK